MSGIVALFHLDGQPAEPATLERLVDPIRHRGADGIKLWLNRSTGLAHLHLQNTPTSHCEVQPASWFPQIAVSFDGRLDNREELLPRLPRAVQDATGLSDAGCVVAAYAEFGDSFGQYLKGDFAIALFDGVQQKMLLLRDVMGIRPLYYCRTQETFLAASEIKSILAYPGFETRPDDDALADLLLAGDPYDKERTCFSRVSRVLPGHTVVITRSEVHSFQHWDFDTTKQVRCAGIAEYAEMLRVLFEQAVRRRLRSCRPVAVMVSGGLDSSAILCQGEILRQAGADVAPCLGIAMTFPSGTDADEKKYLEHIEAYQKIKIQKLAFPRLCFADTEQSVWNSELPQFDWEARSQVLESAQQAGCRVVLDGYYGDQMLANPGYLLDLGRAFRWRQLWHDFTGWGRWMGDVDPTTLKYELCRIVLRGWIPRTLVRGLRRWQGLTEERYPASYALWFRERAFHRYLGSQTKTRRYANYHAQSCYEYLTARPRLNNVESDNKVAAVERVEKAYPLMDIDLAEFLIAIPGCAVNFNGVPKGLFRKAMQDILPESIRLRNWKADFTSMNDSAASECVRSRRDQAPISGCGSVCMDSLAVKTLSMDQGFDSLQVRDAIASRALELWMKSFFGEKGNFISKQYPFVDNDAGELYGDGRTAACTD